MTDEDCISVIVSGHFEDHKIDDPHFKSNLEGEVLDICNDHIHEQIELWLRDQGPLREAVREALEK